MATPRIRKPRASRTRADVENDFDALEDRVSSAEQRDPQAAKLAAEHATATRARVATLSVDVIVSKGASLGLDIQRTLNGLTEQCVEKAKEYQTLEAAVILEAAELERLYDLDVVSASTEILIQEHNARKAESEKDFEAVRVLWAKEQEVHTKVVRERDLALADARRKDQSDYEYRIQTERSRSEDAFAEKVRLQERDFADREALFNKDLAARKAQIAGEEQEIATLKARVAGIDEEIRKATTKEVAIATGAMKREYEHEKALSIRDHHALISLEQQKNQALETSNKALAEQVLKLQTQLDAAKDQVAAIATKAIEGASGQAALSKVMELQQNGANQTRTGGKS